MRRALLIIKAKKLLMGKMWFSFIWIAMLFTGCVTTPLKVDLTNDTNIKFIKTYQEVTAEKWQKTDIMVQKEDAVIIVPLYPKGFIHSVQGKVGDAGKPFEGLDVDLGDIYTAQTDGFLHFGMDQKAKSVHTGIFVFKTNNFDNILSDITYLQKNNKDVKMINLTLALLLKKQTERMLAQNKQAEALPVLDQSIAYLEQADAKLYSRTIYQLYREKAVIYKNSQDLANYIDSINKSYDSLIRASEYYSELSQSRFAFMKQLTDEEKFILVTKSGYFESIETGKKYEKYMGSFYLENLPVAYIFLGGCFTENGNLQLSLKYEEKAVEEAIKSGNREIIGSAYRNLANRHRKFGFYSEAEEAYKKASTFCSARSSVCQLNISTAMLKADLGKFDEAIEFIESLSICAHETILAGEAARAYIYAKKKDHKRAIKIGNGTIKNPDFSYGSIAEIRLYCLTGALDSYAEAASIDDDAARYFSVVNEEINRRGNPHGLELPYALALSKLNKRLGKDEISPLQDAIASLEIIRPTAASGKDYQYWENMLKVYDMTVASLYNKGKYLDALNTVEKARSRRFLDDLGNKKLGAKGVESFMVQRANETLEALSILERDMVEAAQTAGIKVRSVYDKDSRLGKKMDNYKATLKEASEADQQFGVVNNIVPVSAEKLQKQIPADTTVVEYYQSEDNLYTWVIDSKKINAVKQELSKDKLRKLIEQYRKALYLDTTRRGVAIVEKDTADFAALQNEAYKLLITQVEKLIKTKKICIVPYDILNYLPFQSLQNGKQYLIEKYAVSYLPSLSVLEYLRKTPHKDNFKILALGNPDLNDPKMDLPAAEKEVDMIKGIFPNAAVYKRDKATAALVKRISPQYDIVHFAAHGEYNATDPLSSCLYLAAGEGEDGKLEVREIFDMTINADMVVTSACQTAMGKISRGDEVLGLTRAFMYAGANSVLGSLWSISDEATAVLMKEFYTNIKTMEKTEALRQAQIKMIQLKEYSHPFYWAAFNITGAL